MEKFNLLYVSGEASEEISLESGKVTFGRGSDVDQRFPDEGLSRLNSTVYSEDGRIWIVDENSTNGTFVNGERVGGTGHPLKEGDVIKIGNHSNLRVVRSETTPGSGSESSGTAQTVSDSTSDSASPMLFPLAIIGIALLIIISSAAVIGYTIISGGFSETSRVTDPYDPTGTAAEDDNSDEDPNSPDPATEASVTPANQIQNTEPTGLPDEIAVTPGPALPTKQYKEMTPQEKDLYVKVKAEKVARLIGNKSSGDIPPAAVASIRKFVDQYAGRFRASRLDDCRGRGSFTRSDMQTVLERASKNVPFITRSFRSQALDPQVGIYVAMIESEHCVCLQSGTGPLGMFQFTYATGKSFGLNVNRGASPSNPDERCEPQPASVASAKYLKFLSGRIGTGPLSIPLAIASYNSGEGGLGQNLMTALTNNASEERSFWTLVANAESLSKQFKSENIKYVPKFFAAAIVGENPRDFGSGMQALSSYTR